MMAAWRGVRTASAWLALTLAGCDGAMPGRSEVDNAAAAQAAAQAAQLAAQQRCMSDALNNTFYRQQSDSELEAALFRQNLDECPTDFTEAFVRLRNAAKTYLAVASQLSAHNGREDTAYQADGLNLLCSIIAGSQCADSAVDEWNTQDSALKARVDAAKDELDSAKADIEQLIARYGLYVRSPDTPYLTQDNGAWNVSNQAENGL